MNFRVVEIILDLPFGFPINNIISLVETSSTTYKKMALEFFFPRLFTMESLLQTLVTNVLNVTHWT